MSSPNLPVKSQATAFAAPEMDELQFTATLPAMLVTVLERRYLSAFQPTEWRIAPRAQNQFRPLLSEIISLGRPRDAQEWCQVMPHVLTACHEPGHAFVMALHGQGDRHRLYLGARRMEGAAARSTTDYLEGQGSAFKAYFAGLQMGPRTHLDSAQMPDMARFLQTAPALAVITGIPSGRGSSLPLEHQSLDRLVRAVGQHQYVLMVVAEPLEPWTSDATLDTCRRLKSEIHSYTRRTISQTRGETQGVSRAIKEDTESWTAKVPPGLSKLAGFCRLGGLIPLISHVASPAATMMQMISYSSMRDQMFHSRQESSGTSWTESGSLELLNANAEAAEQLLQQHIERLQRGRSTGWWRMALYVAAESEAALYAVTGALHSICAGDMTTLDPMRCIMPPAHLVRDAMESGQSLTLLPVVGSQTHPLDESFDSLATCLTSEELAVVVNLPRREIPGLPMRDLSDFALSAPPPTDDSITLGTLQDGLGRDLGAVSVTAAALNRHVFVTGLTGYGKTNTCMQILLEAYQQLGIPFLVLEPAKAEYRSLAQVPELKSKLRIYSIGGDSPAPFRLNPLGVVPGAPLGRHIDLLKAVFNASFPMFAGMPYILEEAILEVYAERGWSIFTSRNDALPPKPSLDDWSALLPSLEDLHEKIEVVLARKKYGQEIHQNMGAALRSRLRSLMVGNKGLMLNTRRSTPLADLFESPTIIELQNLGDDEEKAFVMAVLFALLYECAEVRQRDLPESRRGQLLHLTLVEEAHRLLQATHGPASAEVADPRGKAVSMFTDMLAEMRAYGEGFIIADQIPTKLAPETLKNSNLKIVHRLVAPDDRLAVGSCINLTDQQMRHLSTLSPGLAIVHDERIGEAVLTRIYPAKDVRAPHVSVEELAPFSQPVGTRDRIYLHRHAGCRSCPSPCDYYHRLEEAGHQEDLGRALDAFLESLLLDDLQRSWVEWERWRASRRVSDEASGPGARMRDSATGVTYCAATQAAYNWLGRFLVARGQTAQRERQLTPADRLLRERAVLALGKLFVVWVRKSVLDEEAHRAFIEARQLFVHAVASDPPRALPGCEGCPMRCRAVAFVGPHLTRLEKDNLISAKFSLDVSADACLEVIRRTAEQYIPALARRKDDSMTSLGLVYCLLANSTALGPLAARRDQLLHTLRERLQSAAGGVVRG